MHFYFIVHTRHDCSPQKGSHRYGWAGSAVSTIKETGRKMFLLFRLKLCSLGQVQTHLITERRFLEVVPPKALRKQRISLPLVQKDIISLGSEAANKRQKVTSQMWSLSKKLFMWTQMRVRMTRMEGGIILTLLMSHMSGHLLRRLTPL